MKITDILIILYIIISWVAFFYMLSKVLFDIPPFLFNFLYHFITALILIPVSAKPAMNLYKIIAVSFWWGIVYIGGLTTAIWLGIGFNEISIFILLYIPNSLFLNKLLHKENKSSKFMTGIFISYVGVLIMAHELEVKFTIPIIFVIISATGLAVSKYLFSGIKVNSLSLLGYISVASSIMSLIISYIFEKPDLRVILHLSIPTIFSLVCAVLVSIAIFGPWIYLNKSHLSKATTFGLLIPTLGNVVPNILNEDTLSIVSIFGMSLNIIGAGICFLDNNAHSNKYEIKQIS